MRSAVVSVEPNGHKADHLRSTHAGESRPPGGGARFSYPSGSQPLAGYTIKRGIGHGGFGEVYYALSDAGKEVAIKLIRRNLEIELRGIKHCLNLKHPNLVSIYDVREDAKGDNWVVMEYITGDSLEEVITRNSDGMPREQALAWFCGIAAGVAYLHDHGIVHRDLKPGNIFCDENLVKLGDYGLSKFISCSRRSGQTESVGTVHYMAPEIANGRYGKEIDIYALGVILYEMLTGRVPFEGESVGEVLMKHLTAQPDLSRLDEPYRSVVAKALEKDPAKRFATVGALVAALPRPAEGHVYIGPMPAGESAGAAAAVAAETTPPPLPAQLVDEEPILCAVRQFCMRTWQSWNQSSLNTPAKIIILTMLIVTLATTAEAWLPIGFVLFFAYGIYWVIRAMVLSCGSGPRPRVALPPGSPFARPMQGSAQNSPRPQPATAAVPARSQRGWRRNESPADALVLKPARERVADLLGSLLGSAIVAMILSAVMLIVNGYAGNQPLVTQGAWLVLVSIAGCWAVLIPSKLWEGSQGEAVIRRFALMVIGLGVGAVAFLAADGLGVPLPFQLDGPRPHFGASSTFYVDGRPLLMAHMAAFGMLFLIIRWWRLADPLRASRLSIGATVVCVVFAWLTSLLWRYPMPWLLMVACTMAVAVQLSSPWIHPRVRRNRAISA